MSEEEKSREKILDAARREFLQKGFQKASLRQIAREAGGTTGSLYWHFKNKQELFDALVEEHYTYIMNLYQDAVTRFFAMTPIEQKIRLADIGGECMTEVLEYIYQYEAEFKLLIDRSAGTRYENMMHELTKAEIDATHQFTEQMEGLGIQGRQISTELEHILVSGMFAGLFELIRHGIPLETARGCVRDLHDFYTAGWRYLLNLPEECS